MGDDVAMPENCLKCKYSRFYDTLFVECGKYGWKIHVSVARSRAACMEDDKHHVFPHGRKVPIKLYKQGKVIP